MRMTGDGGSMMTRTMALAVLSVMIGAIVPLMSANVAAGSGSVTIISPTGGYVLSGQPVHVHASFSGIYCRSPDYGDPNAMLQDTPNLQGLRYWYYPTTSGSYDGSYTPSGLGTHTLKLWYATGWDRNWQCYKYASTSKTILVLDPSADADGDGCSNAEEVQWGTNPFGQEKWAVIVCGAEERAVQNEAQYAFDTLTAMGYGPVFPNDDHICYLNVNTEAQGVDCIATVANVQWAIQTWLDRSDQDDILFIYMIGHGLENTGDLFVQDGSINVFTFDSWLDSELYFKETLVVDCCYSGNWLAAHELNEITITSCGYDEESYGTTEQIYFSRCFWSYIDIMGLSIQSAFQAAYDAVQEILSLNPSMPQHPMMMDWIWDPWYP
ncbi:MAG TPA: C13 family peptidase [Thermoplasmata archaeon]